MAKVIPNVLTLCNLVTGFLGIMVISGQLNISSLPQLNQDTNINTLTYAFVCVCISGVFDLFDGWIARKLGADGELGKQLDSLADLVSFGVLPAIFLYIWLIINNIPLVFILVPIAIVVCSAIRLAKFNIDDSQSNVFLGVPTPASAIFITSLIFWSEYINTNPYLIVVYGIFIAFMMVAKIPIMALKSLGENQTSRVVFISLGVLSLFLFFILGLKAIAVVMHLYILISILFYLKKKI